MQKPFTPIVWNYQSHKSKKTSELISMGVILEPCSWLDRLLDRFQSKIPEIKDETLKRIIEQA